MAYTNWYRTGTINPVKGSTAITGTGTYFKTANLHPGDIVKINGVDYELASVTDDTHLTLKTAYTGDTASGVQYSIVRNFTATTNAEIAAQAASILYSMSRFIDEEQATIMGKSAYEVALSKGYVGTEAQWLESLKAAGEWSNASSRLTTLEGKTSALEGVNAGTRLTALETDNTSNKSRLNTAEAKDTFKYPTKTLIIKNENAEKIYGEDLKFTASTSAADWANKPYLGDWVTYKDPDTNLGYQFVCIDIDRQRADMGGNGRIDYPHNSWWMVRCHTQTEDNILRMSMHSTDSAAQGFAGTDMWKTKLTQVYNYITTIFPNLKGDPSINGKGTYGIKYIPHNVSNGVDADGKVTGMVRTRSLLQIASAEEIYEAGRYYTGIPYFEGTYIADRYRLFRKGSACFSNIGNFPGTKGAHVWTRDPASATQFWVMQVWNWGLEKVNASVTQMIYPIFCVGNGY